MNPHFVPKKKKTNFVPVTQSHLPPVQTNSVKGGRKNSSKFDEKKVEEFDFKKAIADANKLVETKTLAEKVKERKVKSMKMPMQMLKGIREKKIKLYKEQKERLRRDPGLSVVEKPIDVDFYLKKQHKKKYKNLLTEEKSYKYSDMVRKQPNHGNKDKYRHGKGRGKDQNKGRNEAVLKFSKREIESINGRGGMKRK